MLVGNIINFSALVTDKVTSDWFILELFTGQFQLEIAIGRIGDLSLDDWQGHG